MSGEFLGIFENSVHKQRVIIPASFKKKFAEEALKSVVVTLGPNNTIAIYPLDNWKSTLERLKLGNDRSKQLRTQLIDFAMMEQVLEGPGRVRIHEMLLSEVGIDDSVIIKGEGHYISLWNPEVYAQVRASKLQSHKVNFNSEDYQL
ncbi:MAG: protein MraZ [Candidatus Cloacimonetes bacterium]|jgi:division/cell wall cluster transcriptional repressor MraZ|nr:protein MraZ [Candidatus Cloacimonadota bacterium]MDY0336816.1 protein MraZ [Candidatus Cloacimonadaceae bacterium]MDD2684459.1 protein MraZ [Candidatus Cloacimonadota bacterium]MDD3097486.1 protein MraZ [Candidatus Cloacimonadota bacterium]MDD4667819.1 protein MraZ [Candidatus Cloacimonadota bacterium]